MFQLRVPHHSPSLKDFMVGTGSKTWRQKAKQRPWKTAAYCPRCLAVCLLLQFRFTCPRVASPSVGRTLPQPSTQCPADFPSDHLMEGACFSTDVPFSQMMLACVGLTQKRTSHRKKNVNNKLKTYYAKIAQAQRDKCCVFSLMHRS